MVKKIYVGNLSFETTESEIRELFTQHGTVQSVSLITDSDTGRSRGFAFVEMPDDEAAKAMAALNGTELSGRTLRVNEARKPGGGGGGGGRRGPRRQW